MINRWGQRCTVKDAFLPFLPSAFRVFNIEGAAFVK